MAKASFENGWLFLPLRVYVVMAGDCPKKKLRATLRYYLCAAPLMPVKGVYDRPAVFVQCKIVKFLIHGLLNLRQSLLCIRLGF